MNLRGWLLRSLAALTPWFGAARLPAAERPAAPDLVLAIQAAAREAGRGQAGELLRLTSESIDHKTPAKDRAYFLALRAVALALLHRNAEAIQMARWAEASARAQPNNQQITDVFFFVARVYRSVGAGAEAIRLAERDVRRDASDLDALNELAWLLATVPEDALRNGAEALRLAEKVTRLAGRSDLDYVGTLAAALAEVGRFDEAAELQADVVRRLRARRGSEGKIARSEEYLAAFRARQPWREKPSQAELQRIVAVNFSE